MTPSKRPDRCIYCDGEGNSSAGGACGFCDKGIPLDTQEDWDRTWGRVLDTDHFDTVVANWHSPSRLSRWIMRRLGCTFPETNHEALFLNYKAVVKQRNEARAERDQLRAELDLRSRRA